MYGNETLDGNFTMSESLRRCWCPVKIWGGGNPQSSPREYSNVIEEEMISMVRAGNEFGLV